MGRAVLVAVGDELLSGLRREGNCARLAWRLHDSGWTVVRMEVVPDESAEIVAALARWVGAVDLLVLSGGLGPTHDDKTRAAFAEYLGSPLRNDDALYDRVVARYEGERRRAVEGVRAFQSGIPAAACGVYNPTGTALGLHFEREGTRVWGFPGVPSEFDSMVRQELDERLCPDRGWVSVAVAGRSELDVVGQIPEVIADAALHVSVLPSFGTVELVLRGSPVRVAEAESLVRSRFASEALPRGCSTLQEAVVALGEEKGLTLACAESCTGGLLGGALTEVPGSSSVFMGSAVVYANEAKTRLLGVSRGLIERFGAVGGECAAAMASGARGLYGTSFAVAVTGVAGPGGGSDARPVGTVWFAVASEGSEPRVFCRRFGGGRERVRECAVKCALLETWRALRAWTNTR